MDENATRNFRWVSLQGVRQYSSDPENVKSPETNKACFFVFFVSFVLGLLLCRLGDTPRSGGLQSTQKEANRDKILGVGVM